MAQDNSSLLVRNTSKCMSLSQLPCQTQKAALFFYYYYGALVDTLLPQCDSLSLFSETLC